MSTYKKSNWLLENEILIFVLASARNDKWQCRFKNPLGKKPRYIRKSTGFSSEALAIEEALRLYREHQSRALLNLRTTRATIESIINDFPEEFTGVNGQMTRAAKKTYWSRFIGDDDISIYTSEDIRRYFRWRVSPASRVETNRKWTPSADTISASTLKMERNLLRKIFIVGEKHGQVAKIPHFPSKFADLEGVHSLPSNNRRGRFNPKKDYQKILIPEFTRIRTGLTNPKWTPVLTDPSLPFHPSNNRWMSISKAQGAFNRTERRSGDGRIFTHLWDRHNYAFFWFMSLLIGNSGIRPAEAAKLRHSDIRLKLDSDGKAYTLINIRESVSKTKKARVAVCRDFHMTFERYLIYRQEIEYRFNVVIDDDDWVFPATNKKEFYLRNRSKYQNVFRPHLQRLGLHKREVKDYPGVFVFFSAYSFRSFFITQRLKHGMDIHTLARNVGSSAKTIATAYDYNENWAFRKQITNHYKGEPSSSLPADLIRHAETWSD